MELGECVSLQVIDLSNTHIVNLPRELSQLKNLVEIDLRDCNLSKQIGLCYSQGISSIRQHLTRKAERRYHKKKLHDILKEKIYPEVDSVEIWKCVEEVMNTLKDQDTDVLKKLIHNADSIFNVKFQSINAKTVKGRLLAIQKKSRKQEEEAEFELVLRACYPHESLEDVRQLAKDIFEKTDGHERKIILHNKQ